MVGGCAGASAVSARSAAEVEQLPNITFVYPERVSMSRVASSIFVSASFLSRSRLGLVSPQLG